MISSQPADADTGLSDPYPRSGSPDIFLADDDDEDGWEDGLDHLDDPCAQSLVSPPRCAQDSLFVDITGHQGDSLGLELAFDDADDMLGSHPGAAGGLLELEEDALAATWTARFPLLADDDLLYGSGGSEAPLAPFTPPSGLTPSTSCTTFASAGFSAAPSRGSPDGLVHRSELAPFSSPDSPDCAGRAWDVYIDC